MRDKSTPVTGRTWYAGRWRTSEEIERRKDGQREPAARRYRERVASDPEYVERERQRNRERQRQCGTALTPQERALRAARRSQEKIELRRLRVAERARTREAAARQRTRAPSYIRRMWTNASPGSIIRLKFPTLAALDASAGRGDWDFRL